MTTPKWIIQARQAEPGCKELEFLISRSQQASPVSVATASVLARGNVVRPTFDHAPVSGFVTLYEGWQRIGSAQGWVLSEIADRLLQVQTSNLTDLMDEHVVQDDEEDVLPFYELINAITTHFPFAVERASFYELHGESEEQQLIQRQLDALLPQDAELQNLALQARLTFNSQLPPAAATDLSLRCPQADELLSALEAQLPGTPLACLLEDWAAATFHSPAVAQEVWLALLPARLDALARCQDADKVVAQVARSNVFDALWSPIDQANGDAQFCRLFQALHYRVPPSELECDLRTFVTTEPELV